MVIAQQNVEQESKVWRRKDLLPMDDYEFRQWVELLAKRTGLYLPENRKTFLLTSLNIRMRELGFKHYRDYFDYVVSGRRGAVEWEILIDRLTVHETRFFRDKDALEMIRSSFLPPLLQQAETLRVNAWSVGCATGEEPYSLAMLLDYELAQAQRDYYLSITATDISRASLAAGRAGVYHNNRLKGMPDIYRRLYCEVVDEDHSKVVAPIRKRVCFSRLNLLNIEQAKVGLMDIIFCQNVLIYFKREHRLHFLNVLANHLRPGGIMVLGAGEITEWRNPVMEDVNYPGILAFRRIDNTGSWV